MNNDQTNGCNFQADQFKAEKAQQSKSILAETVLSDLSLLYVTLPIIN